MRYYKLVGLLTAENRVRLQAIGATRRELELELIAVKENNPLIQSVQRTSLDELCTMDVEPEWFRQRVVKEIAEEDAQ